MNAYIIGIDKLADGAVKLYCIGDQNYSAFTAVNRSGGTKYCDRIGAQCFDVFVSDKTFARYSHLGFTKQTLEDFYKNKTLLPFKPSSYNGKFFMSFDDFGLAAVLMQSNMKGGHSDD